MLLGEPGAARMGHSITLVGTLVGLTAFATHVLEARGGAPAPGRGVSPTIRACIGFLLLWAAADQYIDIFRSLSRRLYGHDIPYVLLLHVTAFNAKMVPDLIGQLRERGFHFITLQEALSDPAYAIDPSIGYPGGGPMQELLAAARKLPFPPAVKPIEWLNKTCR